MRKGAMMGREPQNGSGLAVAPASHTGLGVVGGMGLVLGSDSNLLSDTGQVTRPPWFQFSHL